MCSTFIITGLLSHWRIDFGLCRFPKLDFTRFELNFFLFFFYWFSLVPTHMQQTTALTGNCAGILQMNSRYCIRRLLAMQPDIFLCNALSANSRTTKVKAPHFTKHTEISGQMKSLLQKQKSRVWNWLWSKSSYNPNSDPLLLTL